MDDDDAQTGDSHADDHEGDSPDEETRDNVVPGSEEELSTPDVRGPDFRGDLDIGELLETYATTGFQATHLAEAIDIAERMQEDDATVYLTFTSNIISSGLRETVAYLVREGYVDVLITTSGSLTEDIIKTAKPFKMGEWDADEAELRERGINRLGNIYVPSDRYVWLEEFLYDFFDDFFAEQKVRTPTAFAREVGQTLEDDDSVLKQAADNDVPVYCPALTDAEVGNFLYYYRQGYDSEIGIEILDDYDSLIEDGLLAGKTGLIAVGGGVPKHHAIMTNLFRGGADYAVYISTGMEGDGSLSGAPPNEAVSWGKIKDETETNYTQVEAEATLVFPLLVAGAFA
ncbi:deoxyhypusine synthase [Halopenitus malekzadehii]|uniref:Probable deoxyhypusine synthase n=1 Tax=Halopenitus malekzadehii TaxID=1267564 RepID=A0A1H6J685_9EURY|nr:deoxyhypusine synthase [Halopenitus malekzadehii]SEH57476.1 deoxyhypusine synthase [Halopenitus malekzadehii]